MHTMHTHMNSEQAQWTISSGPSQNPAQQFASQLKMMKDMGIQDEAVCIKALQVMGGDVQAAIDLIFSGWSGEDDSAN